MFRPNSRDNSSNFYNFIRTQDAKIAIFRILDEFNVNMYQYIILRNGWNIQYKEIRSRRPKDAKVDINQLIYFLINLIIKLVQITFK